MIAREIVLQAIRHAGKFYGIKTYDRAPNSTIALAKIIGDEPDQTGSDFGYFTYKPETEDKIRAIAGPHWYALLKAMEVNKETA